MTPERAAWMDTGLFARLGPAYPARSHRGPGRPSVAARRQAEPDARTSLRLLGADMSAGQRMFTPGLPIDRGGLDCLREGHIRMVGDAGGAHPNDVVRGGIGSHARQPPIPEGLRPWPTLVRRSTPTSPPKPTTGGTTSPPSRVSRCPVCSRRSRGTGRNSSTAGPMCPPRSSSWPRRPARSTPPAGAASGSDRGSRRAPEPLHGQDTPRRRASSTHGVPTRTFSRVFRRPCPVLPAARNQQPRTR